MCKVPSAEKKSVVTSSGCELPEEVRRYYLDIMGIQVWDDAIPVVAPSVDDDVWRALQKTVASCTLCDLHQHRTQTVFGVGSQRADVLVIGEAPADEEDAQGESFVGPAGALLDAMLLAIGLQRQDVYMVNIVKCQPPENRDPKSSEIDCCTSYLRQQIDLIQPRVIFAMGRVAAQALLKSSETISALREKQHVYQGLPLIASYHPAYLLRKPTEKRKAWQDLQALKRILENCQ